MSEERVAKKGHNSWGEKDKKEEKRKKLPNRLEKIKSVGGAEAKKQFKRGPKTWVLVTQRSGWKALEGRNTKKKKANNRFGGAAIKGDELWGSL